MTEREYYLFLIGNRNKQISEMRIHRRYWWTMVCGYGDPKKLPANEFEFLPLEGDNYSRRNKMTPEQIVTAFNKLKNIKPKK